MNKTPQKKTALLVGATGLIGGHCLKFLVEDDDYEKVILLLRKNIKVDSKKVEQHVVDFDNLNKHRALIKANHVFCCLGTTIKQAKSKENFRKVDYEYPFEIAKVALENGAEKFLIVTAMGADKSSLIFYNRVKGEVEKAIRSLPYKAIHIFRPSLLLGERRQQRLGEEIGAGFFRLTSFLFQGPLKKLKPIEGKTVARAMVYYAKQNTEGVFIHDSGKIQSVFDRLKKDS